MDTSIVSGSKNVEAFNAVLNTFKKWDESAKKAKAAGTTPRRGGFPLDLAKQIYWFWRQDNPVVPNKCRWLVYRALNPGHDRYAVRGGRLA